MTSFKQPDAPCLSGRVDNDLGVFIPPEPLPVIKQPAPRKHCSDLAIEQDILYFSDYSKIYEESGLFEGGRGEYEDGSF